MARLHDGVPAHFETICAFMNPPTDRVHRLEAGTVEAITSMFMMWHNTDNAASLKEPAS